jgi:hypothetical protein
MVLQVTSKPPAATLTFGTVRWVMPRGMKRGVKPQFSAHAAQSIMERDWCSVKQPGRKATISRRICFRARHGKPIRRSVLPPDASPSWNRPTRNLTAGVREASPTPIHFFLIPKPRRVANQRASHHHRCLLRKPAAPGLATANKKFRAERSARSSRSAEPRRTSVHRRAEKVPLGSRRLRGLDH